jgi:hypothetical protein
LNLDHHSPAQEAGRFCTTQWSVVLLSALSQAPGLKAALAELCRLYWFPLCAFGRRRGYSPLTRKTWSRAFFLHLLDHKALVEVDPRKGRFRSFLLASIKNCLSYEQAADQVRVSIVAVKTLIHRMRKQFATFYVRRSLARCRIQRKSTRRSIRFAKHWWRPKDGWVHESGEHTHLLGAASGSSTQRGARVSGEEAFDSLGSFLDCLLRISSTQLASLDSIRDRLIDLRWNPRLTSTGQYYQVLK